MFSETKAPENADRNGGYALAKQAYMPVDFYLYVCYNTHRMSNNVKEIKNGKSFYEESILAV